MEAKDSAESSSASDGGNKTSDSVVEVNVKTLDSRIYKFHADKNMPVSLFKEKIANEIGLPVIQQRLIFRGKVLKDDQPLSEYHVDNGHTIHLVERQASESSSSTSETSTNNGGQDAGSTGARSRVGHVSHSVVLGTLNLGDPWEGVVPDLSRVIGAALNSIGIGGQAIPGGVPTVQINAPGQPQPGNVTERSQNGSGIHNQAAQQGQGLPNQSLPQVLRIPIGASIPIPTLNSPIPDSLRTLSDFMSRMELVLSQNGYGPNNPPISAGDSPPSELASNARGLSTHESLSSVMRRAEMLLSNNATAALSHIAERLEREGGSMDPTVRGQIQTESIQVGMAIQHLGSLLLELGRTILTLRMGQSPAETFINSGPAVYISSFGPNPIMVQPFPLQATTMFGASPPNSSSQDSLAPNGIGTVSRNVNIHIHTAVAPGAAVAQGLQGERHNRTADSGQTQQSSASVQQSTDIEGQSENNSVQSGGVSNAQRGTPSINPSAEYEARRATPRGLHEGNDKKEDKGGPSNSKGTPSSSSGGVLPVPLGLGMGGLKPKSRVQPERSQDRSSSESGGSDNPNVEEQMRERAHQVLQTLKTFTDRSSETPTPTPTRQMPIQTGGGGGGQSSNSQFDIANAMSQVFDSPAFNGLLSGISQQTGAESPDMLKNMIMQVSQNPEVMNTMGQMAQQLQGQQQGRVVPPRVGGMDLSRMVQQMMPLVSQVLSGGGRPSVPASSSQSHDVAQRRLGGDDDVLQNIQVDLQDVVERIEKKDAPKEIFSSMVEAAAQLDDTCSDQLIEELCDNETLAKEFIELLRDDISSRVEGENKNS